MLPPLTTVRTPRSRIGTEAATMLLALMRRQTPPANAVDVGYELVIRGST
jgi:LacI family gluconate utilization system Gnt-I transcriptional repressor